MANINTASYDLTMTQTVDLIKAIGTKKSVLVEGHMGSGKSSILKMLAAEFPTHTAVYFDCTNKDLMDLGAPKVVRYDETGMEYLTMIPNEELGLHFDRPILLMFDEIGKNKGIINGVRRILLERAVFGRKLHPDSYVFATTNLGAENVGDVFPPHSRNAIVCTRMRKYNAQEWVEMYAINADVHPVVMAWVLKDAPQVFQSFEEVEKPDAAETDGGNPYIYHPKAVGRRAFTTHRSVEGASDIIKQKDLMDDMTLKAALAGTVGVRAAADLVTYMKIAEDMPTTESIKESPKTAKIPASAAAVCMVIMRTLNTLDRSWINAWMEYMERLDAPEQAMFALSVRSQKYKHRELVMTNKKYTEWCLKNQHLNMADKK